MRIDRCYFHVVAKIAITRLDLTLLVNHARAHTDGRCNAAIRHDAGAKDGFLFTLERMFQLTQNPDELVWEFTHEEVLMMIKIIEKATSPRGMTLYWELKEALRSMRQAEKRVNGE